MADVMDALPYQPPDSFHHPWASIAHSNGPIAKELMLTYFNRMNETFIRSMKKKSKDIAKLTLNKGDDINYCLHKR